MLSLTGLRNRVREAYGMIWIMILAPDRPRCLPHPADVMEFPLRLAISDGETRHIQEERHDPITPATDPNESQEALALLANASAPAPVAERLTFESLDEVKQPTDEVVHLLGRGCIPPCHAITDDYMATDSAPTVQERFNAAVALAKQRLKAMLP